MDEKQKGLLHYLEQTHWAPVDFLLEKFSMNRPEFSDAVEQIMALTDVRVKNDIIHVG